MTQFNQPLYETDLSAQIEGDFIALLDDYYSLPEVYDDELDAQIHRWYSNPPKVWPQRPYFSPSQLGSCPRELYLKSKGAKKDGFRQPPHQGRQKALGTRIGDLIQRDLLAIERNYERLTGNVPRFKFERNPDGTPRFEEFAKTNKLVEHNGERFYLYGSPDGIMTYTTDNGEQVRVGIEIKSKQSTPARTSHYSMKDAEDKHIAQITAYAHMFDADYYVVLYVNAAKQAWFMSPEQYAKTPDIRAFCKRITPEMKAPLFDKAASIVRAVRENDPPALDLGEWTFNNFKTACARSLSDEEYADIHKTVKRVMNSGLPERKKADYARVLADIERLRGEGAQ